MPVAVITGGNKGLGLAQTKRFSEEGYRVVVVARSEGQLSEVHGNVSLLRHDLLTREPADYLTEVHRDEGGIDVLVNNAGMHLKKPVWEVSSEELNDVLQLNVGAMFAACGRFVELCHNKGGSIVNVSSMGGILALPSAAAYVTAKTAVVGLTRSVATDAAPFGIRCNAVSPGFIETDMTRAILTKDPERRDRIERRIPTHSFGTPGDVADAIYYLASERAAYINGINLPVDGGYAIGF